MFYATGAIYISYLVCDLPETSLNSLGKRSTAAAAASLSPHD